MVKRKLVVLLLFFVMIGSSMLLASWIFDRLPTIGQGVGVPVRRTRTLLPAPTVSSDSTLMPDDGASATSWGTGLKAGCKGISKVLENRYLSKGLVRFWKGLGRFRKGFATP